MEFDLFFLLAIGHSPTEFENKIRGDLLKLAFNLVLIEVPSFLLMTAHMQIDMWSNS